MGAWVLINDRWYNRTVVGVDTAKRVFQLHWIDMETGEIVDLKLTRAKFLEHFANRAPCLVAMEACGGTQHWARRIREFDHEVRLLPAKTVRPFVSGNKNDAHDARAIWTAVQQPGVKTVAIKTEEQQAILALHLSRAVGWTGALSPRPHGQCRVLTASNAARDAILSGGFKPRWPHGIANGLCARAFGSREPSTRHAILTIGH